MSKLLLVYNTSGIEGMENSRYYIESISSILDQTFQDYQLLISGCCLKQETKDALLRQFNGLARFIFVDKIYPVTVTFNLACLTAIKKFEKRFDGYFYIDSGCKFIKNNDLSQLVEAFYSQPDIGMYSARVDDDSGYYDWFGIGEDQHEKLFINGDFQVPIGKACNLHAQIFSDKLMQYYGRPYPDIFAGHCSESSFTFLCAAIQTRMVINKDVILHHQKLDGQSGGFDPWKWEKLGNRRWEHPYLVSSVMDRVSSTEARRLGLGYEEMRGLVIHDTSQYENGFCINTELKNYIRDNLFVPNNLLDYDKIEYSWLWSPTVPMY